MELITQSGLDYYVKLVDISSQRDAIGVYVIGGHRMQIDVPLGTYDLRYAAGDIWCGLTEHFGANTIYSRTESLFTFSSDAQGYNGYTVELILQRGGNLETQHIDKSQF